MNFHETRNRHYPHYFLFLFFVLGGLILLAAGTGEKVQAKGDLHSADMEKQTCIQCHLEVTPDIVKEYRESAHGFTFISCGVCHGDKDNFRKQPGNSVCIGCHAKAVEGRKMKDKTCASCHPVHHFTMHRVKDYQKKAPPKAQKGGPK